MVEVLGALNTDAARKAMVNLAYYDQGEATMDALEWQVREQGVKILPFINAALDNPETCDPYFIHAQHPVACRTAEAARQLLARWQLEIIEATKSFESFPQKISLQRTLHGLTGAH